MTTQFAHDVPDPGGTTITQHGPAVVVMRDDAAAQDRYMVLYEDTDPGHASDVCRALAVADERECEYLARVARRVRAAGVVWVLGLIVTVVGMALLFYTVATGASAVFIRLWLFVGLVGFLGGMYGTRLVVRPIRGWRDQWRGMNLVMTALVGRWEAPVPAHASEVVLPDGSMVMSMARWPHGRTATADGVTEDVARHVLVFVRQGRPWAATQYIRGVTASAARFGM